MNLQEEDLEDLEFQHHREFGAHRAKDAVLDVLDACIRKTRSPAEANQIRNILMEVVRLEVNVTLEK